VLKSLAAALAPHLVELLGLTKNNSVDEDGWSGGRTSTRGSSLMKQAPRQNRSHTSPDHRCPGRSASLLPPNSTRRRWANYTRKLGMRRLTDAERAAKGMPPYDVNREYEESQAREKERERERAERERADNDPSVAAQRAAATRVADAARALKSFKMPRVRCTVARVKSQREKMVAL
jgi:hypothetical protein